MATLPQFTQEQLLAARKPAFHQADEPLLTLESVRAWVESCGLLAFAPLPQLGAPMPSLVEATLGTAKPEATAADADTARGLVARLLTEGSALPVNLLGNPGDAPDFVISASAFPFLFTLRGDKGWKRAPETSGAVKVTPLALRVFEILSEKGALGAEEITTEVGREVTESAIVRALGELWSILRIIPLYPQTAGEPVLWELTTRRFLKAVKAGANAGQPTALSAFASLYLGQVFAATEEEVEGFLSPLTARSRVREVLHGLTAARELSEIVVDGKNLLFLPESLPDFAAFAPQEAEAEEGANVVDAGQEAATPSEASERIGRFKPAARGGDFRGKPAKGGYGNDRPKRSFGSSERPARPAYNRPWDEERADRAPREGADGPAQSAAPEGAKGFAPRGDRPFKSNRPSFGGGGGGFRKPGFGNRSGGGDRPFRPRPEGGGDRPFRPRPEGGGDRPFRPRPSFGDRPSGDRPFRPVGDRPFRPRPDGGGDRPNRPFTPREGGGDRPFRPRPSFGDRPSGDRPFRPAGDRPFRPRPDGGGDRPNRPFTPREGGGDRPFRPRPSFGDRPSGDRPFRPRTEGSDRPNRPFTPREGGGDRPFRKPGGFSKPGFGGRPSFGGDRPSGGGRPSFGGDRPFRPRPEGGGDRPNRPFTPREGGGDRPFRPRPSFGDRPSGDRPFRPRTEGAGGGEGRPFRKPGGFSKPGFGGRPSFGGGGRPSFGGGDRPARPAGGGFSRPGGRPAGGGYKGGGGGFKPRGPKGPGAGGPPRRRPEEE